MGRIENLKIYNEEVYSEQTEEPTLLLEGDYWGRHFAIVRHRLGFPDAYIEVKPDDYIMSVEGTDYDKYESTSMYVNCGATYYGSAYWNKDDKRTYVGWDYAHFGDYDPYSSSPDETGHKWTICEILMDVAHAVEGMERDNDLNK